MNWEFINLDGSIHLVRWRCTNWFRLQVFILVYICIVQMWPKPSFLQGSTIQLVPKTIGGRWGRGRGFRGGRATTNWNPVSPSPCEFLCELLKLEIMWGQEAQYLSSAGQQPAWQPLPSVCECECVCAWTNVCNSRKGSYKCFVLY